MNEYEPMFKDVLSAEWVKRLRKAEYRTYLLSERWHKIRNYVYKRDGCCRDCGSTKNLQAHHTSYRHVLLHPRNYEEVNGRFYDEANDVVTLCEKCHRKRHGIKPQPKPKYDVLDWNGNVIGVI